MVYGTSWLHMHHQPDVSLLNLVQEVWDLFATSHFCWEHLIIIRDNRADRDTPITQQLDKFWASEENKQISSCLFGIWCPIKPVAMLPRGGSVSGGRAAALESEGSRFDSRLLLAMCRSVLEQDTEPLTAPNEQVGALHGFPRHRCMNVWVNVKHNPCKAHWLKYAI